MAGLAGRGCEEMTLPSPSVAAAPVTTGIMPMAGRLLFDPSLFAAAAARNPATGDERGMGEANPPLLLLSSEPRAEREAGTSMDSLAGLGAP